MGYLEGLGSLITYQPLSERLVYMVASRQIESIATRFKALSTTEMNSNGFVRMRNMRIQGHIFKDIVEFGKIDKFYNMSSGAIMNLLSAIESSILRISNSGEFHHQELPHLQKIIATIESNLSTDNWKRTNQKMLIDTMKEAAKHIIKTTPTNNKDLEEIPENPE